MVIIIYILLGLVIIVASITYLFLLTSRDRSVLLTTHTSLTYNDTKRHYLISTPPKKPEKIVIGLHGFGDSARRFAYYTALHNAVDDRTIVVYPEASKVTDKSMKRGWNSGFCCGSGWVNNVDDSGFIVFLVDTIKSQYDARDAKVFVTGFSNGAFMAQRVAIDHPESIDAVAIASGAIGTEKSQLQPSTPIPVLIMHGKQDTVVPFDGGPGSSDPDFTWLSHDKTVSVWQEANTSEATTKQIIYENDKHQWHDWRVVNIWHKTPQASRDVQEFFTQNIDNM